MGGLWCASQLLALPGWNLNNSTVRLCFRYSYVKIHFSVPKLGSFGAPGFPEALERPSGQACGVLELSQVTNALASVPEMIEIQHTDVYITVFFNVSLRSLGYHMLKNHFPDDFQEILENRWIPRISIGFPSNHRIAFKVPTYPCQNTLTMLKNC